MKAIRIHQHGDLDVLKIDEIKKPVPSENQVLVQMKAAALNHLDLFVRKGIPGVPLPIILGSDGTGVIIEVGENVNKFKNGDEVIIMPFKSCETCEFCNNEQEQLCKQYSIRGEHFDGCMAEYAVVDEKYVLHKPANISFSEAAAFPLAYMTAYHMLISKGQLKANQTVLIWGASSGIGSGAIQIAKNIGAKIITTVNSEDKKKYAKNIGADYVINYKEENVAAKVKEITEGKGVDVVFEHPGKLTFPTSMRVLKTGGKIVTCGATTGPIINLDLRHLFIKHQQIIGSTMGNRDDLIELLELITKNRIKPIVSKILPFKEIKEAHKILGQGKQMGKIVIDFT
jgi:NADPH:quinone reductase-like Zn-dependent oxidoreductase